MQQFHTLSPVPVLQKLSLKNGRLQTKPSGNHGGFSAIQRPFSVAPQLVVLAWKQYIKGPLNIGLNILYSLQTMLQSADY
jgi:hypothetical protein